MSASLDNWLPFHDLYWAELSASDGELKTFFEPNFSDIRFIPALLLYIRRCFREAAKDRFGQYPVVQTHVYLVLYEPELFIWH